MAAITHSQKIIPTSGSPTRRSRRRSSTSRFFPNSRVDAVTPIPVHTYRRAGKPSYGAVGLAT